MTHLACWPTPSRRPRQVTATSLPRRPARSNSLTSSSTLAGLRIPSDHFVPVTAVFPPPNSSAIRGDGGERHIFLGNRPGGARLPPDHFVPVTAVSPPPNSSAIRGAGGERHIFSAIRSGGAALVAGA